MKLPKYYGWRIVAALGLTTIVSYGTSQYLFGLLVEPMISDFGWSHAAIGGAYSGTVLVSGVAGLYLGVLLDRYGARRLMATGSLVGGITLLLLAHVHTLWQFQFLWTFGMGLAGALTYYPISFTVIANWFDRSRGKAFSLLTFMGAFASTIFYPISGALIAAYGWPQALVFLAGVQILFCFPLHAVVLRRHPEDHGLNPDGAHAAGASDPASGATFRAAIRSGPFILITTALGLSFFASTVVLVEHVAYLIARGWDPSLAATLVGLFGIAYLPGRALTAYAAGKVSLSTQLAIAFGAEALGVVLLALSSGFISVFAYVVVFGAAYGAIAPLRGAIVAEHFGRRSYGAIIAAQGLIIGIASALGPIVAGGLIDRAGYGLALGACALVFAGAAVAIMFPALRALRVRDRESRR